MIERIAYHLGVADEAPNKALAELLCDTKDAAGIKEMADGLGQNAKIASDCIKVLYEIGYRQPALIAPHAPVFLELLDSNNNRLVWGSMIALSTIAPLVPKQIYDFKEIVFRAYENGSVITRDASITVFAELAKADSAYEAVMFEKIVHHLKTCRPKEVPQHAERAFVCIHEGNTSEFLSVLQDRRNQLSERQRKRVDKLIKKIHMDDDVRLIDCT